MSFARRVAAAALQCALLTMSMIGNGYACGPSDEGAMHGAMAGMADMPGMPGMPMDGPSNGNSDETPSPDCSFPWAPGACHQMNTCSPNAVTVAGSTRISAPSGDHDALARREIALRSVTRSPEPPPPRA